MYAIITALHSHGVNSTLMPSATCSADSLFLCGTLGCRCRKHAGAGQERHRCRWERDRNKYIRSRVTAARSPASASGARLQTSVSVPIRLVRKILARLSDDESKILKCNRSLVLPLWSMRESLATVFLADPVGVRQDARPTEAWRALCPIYNALPSALQRKSDVCLHDVRNVSYCRQKK